LIKPKIKDYPGEHVKIAINNPDLDFAKAKDIARQKAEEIYADPMLLSWYQGKTGESYPNLESAVPVINRHGLLMQRQEAQT